MLRRIVLLRKHEWLRDGWAARSFGPAGVGLASNVKVRGQEFMEMHPVPAFRRLATGDAKPAAPIGRPRQPAAMVADSFAVVAAFDDEDAIAGFRHDRQDEVEGVFADPKIEAAPAYCHTGPIGSTNDVVRLLGLRAIHKKQTGKGVRVAIVDTGIDGNHLGPDGRRLATRIDKTSTFPAAYKPGTSPRDHGTMVAYDTLIAAPGATLLDYALLTSSAGTWNGFLSDALAAFGDLMDLLSQRPGPLVVNNSWALFDRSDDAPVGSPENYSANANHPFNQLVAALVSAGADVVFAAGNCGQQCPDGRCGVKDVGSGASIHGANSHPSVITVAAVTTAKERLGYSSQGPGGLFDKKPDISGYSHFAGSGVYAADGGTSAAAPVVSGVVALLREKLPALTAAQMKALVTRTADPLEPVWSYETGSGLISTRSVQQANPSTQPHVRRPSAAPATLPAAWMLQPTPQADPIVLPTTGAKATKKANGTKKSKSKKITSGTKTRTVSAGAKAKSARTATRSRLAPASRKAAPEKPARRPK
jgi:subtilisin family serine protease